MPGGPTIGQLKRTVQQLKQTIEGLKQKSQRMEDKLRLSLLTIDQADIGIFRITDSGRITYANRQACKSLGYTHDELLGLTVPDINPSFTHEKFKRHRRAMRSGHPKKFETIHRRKDGSIFPVEITVNRIDFAGKHLSITFQRDLTSQKRAQDKIQKNQKHLESIFRASPAGIGLVSNRTLLDINARFCEMTGYTREELVGRTARVLYPSDEEFDFVGQEKYRQISETGTGTVETRLLCKDGKIIHVLMSSSPIDPDDLTAGVTFTALDITAMKQAEIEKADIEAQYVQAQKVEAIGQLAGGVAHDLNNLLSPILGYSELLLNGLSVNDPRRASLEQIAKAGKGARDLVSQLLAFSRKQTLEYETVNLNQVLIGFESLLRRTIRENIDIQMKLAPDIAPVLADIGQIEQIIMNLCINAADAMPNGGRLLIETRMVELDDRYVAAHPGASAGPHAMMVFRDTGHGMDEATCKKVFEPFFSLKGEQGTGLGLSTVYGIVKQHRGSIWVTSAPEQGAEFTIYLPQSDGSYPAPQPADANGADAAGSETILLVEDNTAVRDISRKILEQFGYTVLSAASAPQALALQPEKLAAVDLLLTDVIMPKMNGKQLYTELVSAYPDLKVLYMSGYTNDVIAHQGALEPGVRFIHKPFTAHALAARVRRVLDEK